MFRLSSFSIVLAAPMFLVETVFAQVSEASTIEAINHIRLTIKRFSVDGRSGIDVIGPYQGGGGGRCYLAPKRWEPGMTVRVDWQKAASALSELADEDPRYADWPKYLIGRAKVAAARSEHPNVIPVPHCTGRKVFGLTAHFLPCDEIEVTTSCHALGSPEYPIKSLLRLPEPKSCSM